MTDTGETAVFGSLWTIWAFCSCARCPRISACGLTCPNCPKDRPARWDDPGRVPILQRARPSPARCGTWLMGLTVGILSRCAKAQGNPSSPTGRLFGYGDVVLTVTSGGGVSDSLKPKSISPLGSFYEIKRRLEGLKEIWEVKDLIILLRDRYVQANYLESHFKRLLLHNVRFMANI